MMHSRLQYFEKASCFSVRSPVIKSPLTSFPKSELASSNTSAKYLKFLLFLERKKCNTNA